VHLEIFDIIKYPLVYSQTRKRDQTVKYMKMVLWIIALSLILAGCGGTNEPAPPVELTVENPTDNPADIPYPDPNATPFVPPPTIEYTYPGPIQTEVSTEIELPEKLDIPEPGKDTGIVIGQLLTPGPGGDPYIGVLYLASTLAPSDPKYPPMVAFSEATDPKAVQDRNGNFLFVDVPPGKYAMLIWTPVTNTVIENLETGEYLYFDVNAGEVLDLEIVSVR
jgi:hypothetical protein